MKSNPPKFLIVKRFILVKHVGYFLHYMFSKIMFMICGGFLVIFKLEFVVVFRVVTCIYIYVCIYKYGIFHVLKLYYMYIFIYLFISVCSLQSFLCTPLHVHMFYYCNPHNFHCGYKNIKPFWTVELHSNGLSRYV